MCWCSSMPSKFAIFAAQDGRCFHCGEAMLPSPARKPYRGAPFNNGYTKEHLVPRSLGGGGGKNIVLAHMKCNSKRGATMPTPEMLARAKEIHRIAKSASMTPLFFCPESAGIEIARAGRR